MLENDQTTVIISLRCRKCNTIIVREVDSELEREDACGRKHFIGVAKYCRDCQEIILAIILSSDDEDDE